MSGSAGLVGWLVGFSFLPVSQSVSQSVAALCYYCNVRTYPSTYILVIARVVCVFVDWLVVLCSWLVGTIPVGKGDRAPEDSWERVEGPIDVVLLEGWNLVCT